VPASLLSALFRKDQILEILPLKLGVAERPFYDLGVQGEKWRGSVVH
jgi:hypothetical protein